MNRLETMQVYVRVAELASFTQAADSLGMSKAAVSTAIRQLETGLGTRLLQRTTRRVHMTPDGMTFYERSKHMLDEMEELQTLFRHGAAELSGRLRVDMPVAVARNIVIPQLPAFLRAHPRLQVELSSTDRRVDVVKEGFDCIIRVGRLDDSSLIARPLGHFSLVNCASPDYLSRFGTPRSLADLASHRLVDYAPSLSGRAARFDYMDGAQERSVEVEAAIAVNNSDAYQAACLAGLGIIQAPRTGVGELLASGQLVAVLGEYRAAPMPVTLLYPNRRHVAMRAQRFMQWIADIMQPHVDDAGVVRARPTP
jgi:DNA-binding transcriptional LysR family regulator